MKEFYSFRLDIGNQCLWRERERVPLPPRDLFLLAYFVDRAGKLITRSELMQALWPSTFVQPEVLKTHIRNLRLALGDDARNPRFIETRHRSGYTFIAPVHETENPEGRLPWIPTSAFVGQEEELEILRGAFQQTCGGKPQLVFISGEAGIGKTTLANSMERAILRGTTDARVIRGQCIEGYGTPEPYHPVLDAISDLVRLLGREAIVEILVRHAPAVLARFPWLMKPDQREMISREVGGAASERMLRELCEALDSIAKESPLVIILEDVHRADRFTVDCFAAFARECWTSKVMVVATYRPLEFALSQHPLRTLKLQLAAHQLCGEVAMRRLTLPEVQHFLEMRSLNRTVPSGLTEIIYRHSEGNPLLMKAVLEHLIARNILFVADGSWSASTPLANLSVAVPETIRQLVEIRIESCLSEPEQQLLEAASICGGSFAVADVATVAEMDLEEVDEICTRLSRRNHLISSVAASNLPDGSVSPQYKFVHFLYQKVFSQRVGPIRRARLQENWRKAGVCS
jgi:predicted ATPase